MHTAGKWLALAAVIVVALVAWVTGGALRFATDPHWALTLGAAALALIVAGIVLWRLEAAAPVAAPETGAALEQVLREAATVLGRSQLIRATRLARLPAVLVTGPAGAGKTDAVLRSGLNPSLLAGQITGPGGAVTSTQVANVWFAARAVLLELGGALAAAPTAWLRLARHLRPSWFHALLARGAAPRAAVLCLDCGEIAALESPEVALAALRPWRDGLLALSERLGVRLPVYVLFTRADRLPFFAEFTANLGPAECGQPLGATLAPASPGDLYGERETERLASAFEALARRLAALRAPLLAREREAARLPGIYEFPREIGKLRDVAVPLLVELFRPSQLMASPYLRGFYFAGERSAPAAPEARPRPEIGEPVGGATRVFDPRRMAAPAPPAARPARLPVFLARLWSDVVLADATARASSAVSRSAVVGRRVVLAAAAILAVVACIGLVGSGRANRRLIARADAALAPSGAFAGAPYAQGPLAGLLAMDPLRREMVTLAAYDGHPPAHLGWGLYVGSGVYAAACPVYAARLRGALLEPTLAALAGALERLPTTPRPSDQFAPAYDRLRAYLIVTSDPEKSTPEFLAPVLLDVWSAAANPDPAAAAAARQAFTTYSAQLAYASRAGDARCFAAAPDMAVVAHTRNYLAAFPPLERTYRALLAAADKRFPSVVFNRDFPGSAAVVFNDAPVAGAFTRPGWHFMQQALANPARYVTAENWVLPAAAGWDDASLRADLEGRYEADYAAAWRRFLDRTEVAHFHGTADAARKLGRIAGLQSPLLGLLCAVSLNTQVALPSVAAPFQPAQYVEPAGCGTQYASPSNKQYTAALLDLQGCLDQIAAATGPAADVLRAPCAQKASDALTTTRQLVAQNFRPDSQGGKVAAQVARLLEAPIVAAQAYAQPVAAPGPVALCPQLRELAGELPFRSRARRTATLDALQAVFQPQSGALATLYDSSLKSLLVKVGNRFAANPKAPVPPNPAMVAFYNRAHALENALYPADVPELHFSYQVRLTAPRGFDQVTLSLDGQTLTSKPGHDNRAEFYWPGPAATGASLTGTVNRQQLLNKTVNGPWATLQLFAQAQDWTPDGGQWRGRWVPEFGGQFQTWSVQFELDMGPAPFFRPGYFSALAESCVSRIAR